MRPIRAPLLQVIFSVRSERIACAGDSLRRVTAPPQRRGLTAMPLEDSPCRPPIGRMAFAPLRMSLRRKRGANNWFREARPRGNPDSDRRQISPYTPRLGHLGPRASLAGARRHRRRVAVTEDLGRVLPDETHRGGGAAKADHGVGGVQRERDPNSLTISASSGSIIGP